jgi:hypothetical protein
VTQGDSHTGVRLPGHVCLPSDLFRGSWAILRARSTCAPRYFAPSGSVEVSSFAIGGRKSAALTLARAKSAAVGGRPPTSAHSGPCSAHSASQAARFLARYRRFRSNRLTCLIQNPLRMNAYSMPMPHCLIRARMRHPRGPLLAQNPQGIKPPCRPGQSGSGRSSARTRRCIERSRRVVVIGLGIATASPMREQPDRWVPVRPSCLVAAHALADDLFGAAAVFVWWEAGGKPKLRRP